MSSTTRKITGTFAILGIITIWAVVVVMLVERLSGWPLLAQMLVYLVAGVLWVVPLGPLLRWMETGHFRR